MKVAFVTGGSSGIGRAIALQLAGKGHAVSLLGRNGPALASVAKQIVASGGCAEVFSGDVRSESDIEVAIAGTVDRLGGVDIAVPCAGVEAYGDVIGMKIDEWDSALAVNLTGTMLVARHTIPKMIERGGGAFVAISSDGGVLGAAGFTPYCVSKHAVVGLVRCLAADFGRQGIRSNVVCPSFTDTPMADRILADTDAQRDEWEAAVPLGRFARPDEVASVVCHLASDEASYTNGHVYMVDGGETAAIS